MTGNMHFLRLNLIKLITLCLAITPVISLTKVKPTEWILGRSSENKLNLISWLIDGCLIQETGSRSVIPLCDELDFEQKEDSAEPEYQSFDGFFNNLFHTQLGAVDTPLIRRVPSVYSDGTYLPVTGDRINPFEASERLMTRKAGCDRNGKTEACGSKTGKSALLVYFGQQVVEEILDAQRPGCPPEYFNIKIPENHRFRQQAPKKSFMPFLRSRYSQSTGHSPGNPRQQLNEITPWIDGGLVYGTSKGWADVLRMFPNGTLHPEGQLASHNDEGLFPVRNKVRLPMANPPPPFYHSKFVENHQAANVDRFFVLGNPRGNENTFLLTFGIVLFRWHNLIASYLHRTRPEWSGEKVFQESRKWVIATHQQIIMYDWLPNWLAEETEPYKGYNPALDPQIEQFFQTAAMRFGHTLVTPGGYLRDYACANCKPVPFPGFGKKDQKQNNENSSSVPSMSSIRTCNSYFTPHEPLEMNYLPHENCLNLSSSTQNLVDIDRVLMGLASQRAEREDNMIVEDLRGNVFGPLEFSRRDLMAINIQRGRDHGTPDYNTAREAFGLPRIKNVSHYMSLTTTATPEDIVEEMEKIHGDNPWSNIDVWTGGILETSDRPGPLFRAIIKDQFSRIRDADRFWFENTKWKVKRFSPDAIKRIKMLKVFDIIISVTKMLEEDLQENPFRVPVDKVSDSCSNLNWQMGPCSDVMYNKDGSLIKNKPQDCFYFPQLDSEVNPVEPCSERGSYDYFSGSEYSFIATFVGLTVILFGITFSLRTLQKLFPNAFKSTVKFTTAINSSRSVGNTNPPTSAREWMGHKEGSRAVALYLLDSTEQELKIEVRSPRGQCDILRIVNLTNMDSIKIFHISKDDYLVIKNEMEYDLVLQFETELYLNDFIERLKRTVGDTKQINIENIGLRKGLKSVITRRHRLRRLQKFYGLVFQAPDEAEKTSSDILSSDKFSHVRDMELTIYEFAEALGMDPDSKFMQRVFNHADKDGNGHISFREFFSMLVTLKNGNADDKCILLFRLYDTEKKNKISFNVFKEMIKSMIEAAASENNDMEVDRLVGEIISNEGFSKNDEITVERFMNIFTRHKHTLGYAELVFNGVPRNKLNVPHVNKRCSYLQTSRRLLTSHHIEDQADANKMVDTQPAFSSNKKHWIFTYIETYRLNIFWTVLYTLVVICIFVERAYYYSVEREHGGLRQIAGYGVTITRGAASAMMFCYSTLLLTMCRNIITNLRETFLHQFIPFDYFLSMHKYVACLGLGFSIIHTIGHGINFYHISTQTADDLTCLFRDYYRPTHVLPKFHYWMFQTVTGISGVLLVILAGIIYSFATNYTRSKAFKLFWITHSLYPLWYILMLIHGSGRLVQDPLFLNFLIAPLILFVFDKLISESRQNVEIPVLQAELLPSNVTKLKFVRPAGFQFKSGQWCRIACSALNPNEFHPFTISSSPNDPFLTIHIRAVGPFTHNIRRIYESCLPKIYLDGPYGEGHQDWHKFEVSVLVGGGIGVTPFASILQDVYLDSNPRFCKKVYFLWVTKTQKQFEWLVDIIKKVETQSKISVHVFITQSYSKFDLRTVLLYACERNFERIHNRSLFTGLKSTTHFGKPDFVEFFKQVKDKHVEIKKVGVFTCGPPSLCFSVDSACHQINSESNDNPVEFQHRTESMF